ncbi:MAG: hypothetical protein ACOC70_00400 [bacterium]
MPLVFLVRTVPYRLGLTRKRELLGMAAEHGARGGIITSTLAWILRRERAKIASGKRLWTGTSCLVVARKRRTEPETGPPGSNALHGTQPE